MVTENVDVRPEILMECLERIINATEEIILKQMHWKMLIINDTIKNIAMDMNEVQQKDAKM